jgi:hypothetical protein
MGQTDDQTEAGQQGQNGNERPFIFRGFQG